MPADLKLHNKGKMKLAFIAQHVILKNYSKNILNESGAREVQSKLNTLNAELKKDGEDITDEEVQAAMLTALIKSDGNINAIDVSDVESIKKEIKESRNYIYEGTSGILHFIEYVGTILGNAALLHLLSEALHKIGIPIPEEKLKTNINNFVTRVKSITGAPAKAMELAFEWIAKKIGLGSFGQKIAGISGSLLVTFALFAIGVYLFPSITSAILLIFALTGLVGKAGEIYTMIKKLYQIISEELTKNPELATRIQNSMSQA